MRPRHLALLATGALALAACKPEPDPGTVDLVGDSITVQAILAGSGHPDEPGDLDTHSGLGWQADDVTPWVHNQVADARPETLIVALGVNDAAPRNGGWTWGDVADWVELLDAPHPDACVAVILPAVGPGADPAHAAEVDRARTDITAMATDRDGPTVVADWAPVIEESPDLLDPDGIHLADGSGPYGISSEAAAARMGLYWDAADRC